MSTVHCELTPESVFASFIGPAAFIDYHNSADFISCRNGMAATICLLTSRPNLGLFVVSMLVLH